MKVRDRTSYAFALVSVAAALEMQGNTIKELDRSEVERWIKATQPVTEAWLKESKQRKFDGGALLAEAKALLAKFGS